MSEVPLTVAMARAVAARLGTNSLWEQGEFFALEDYVSQQLNGRTPHVRGVPGNPALLSMQHVIEPLDEMFTRGPESLDDPVFAAKCWHALETLAKVSCRSTVPPEYDLGGHFEPAMPDLDVIKEGAVEAWTSPNMPELTREVVPEFADRLNRLQREHPESISREWPHASQMAEAFAERLGDRLKVPANEVRDLMARERIPGLVPAVADLAIRKSRIPEFVPDWDRRPEVPGTFPRGAVGRIQWGLREALGKAAPTREMFDPPPNLAEQTPDWPAPDGRTPRQYGTQLADGLLAAVQQEEREYLESEAETAHLREFLTAQPDAGSGVAPAEHPEAAARQRGVPPSQRIEY
jgi:hypothetical protein